MYLHYTGNVIVTNWPMDIILQYHLFVSTNNIQCLYGDVPPTAFTYSLRSDRVNNVNGIELD
jgi:hypothetical protein